MTLEASTGDASSVSTDDLAARIRQQLEMLQHVTGAVPGDHVGRVPRELLEPFFYGSFVDREVIAADTAMAADLWLNGGAAGAVFGYTSRAAATISVPVFLGFGEQDASASPHQEPAAYSQSRDVTLFVLPSSAHCHNFAPTRKQLWDRMIAWAD